MNGAPPRPPIPSDIPPEKLAQLLHAMQVMRDDLLKVSFLLRDHLEQIDSVSREQARQASQALIRQSMSDANR